MKNKVDKIQLSGFESNFLNRIFRFDVLNIRNFIFSGLLLLTTVANAQWVQVGQDINGSAVEDNSGYSVSLSADGSIVAIGSPLNDVVGESSGLVRVYKLQGGLWTQLGSDILGEKEFDTSGHSISISSDGTRVAIGSQFGTGQSFGHARIFQFKNGDWVQLGQDIVGEAPGDQSGIAVALSGDGNKVAIGAINNDGNGNSSGQVRVLRYLDPIWGYVGRDLDGKAAFDVSGGAIALSFDGSIVAIGAIGNDDNGTSSGQVRVYQAIGTKWTQLGQDIDGEAANDGCGSSVALSSDGKTLAIGALGNDGNGSNSGNTRIFQLIDTSWIQIGSDINGEAANDGSGNSVSLSSDGSRVAIGATMNDGKGSNSGHVRVYQNKGGVWVQVGTDINGEAPGDQSGISVSLSSDGTIVAIGANGNDGGGDVSGHVRVYKENTVISTKDNIDNEKQFNISILPDPAKDFATVIIRGFENDEKNLEMFDVCGKIVYKQKLRDNQNILHLELNALNLHSGLYLIRVSDGHKQNSRQMIIEQ